MLIVTVTVIRETRMRIHNRRRNAIALVLYLMYLSAHRCVF